jgi:hypothetical protein
LVITQLFFGLGWLRATAEKVISIDWWTGATVQSFVADHAEATLPWFLPAATGAAAVAPVTSLLVLAAEAAIGLALVVNRKVAAALAAAITLNLAFVATGAVNPSAFYLIGQGAIVLWLVGRRTPSAAVSTGLRIATAVAVALAAISVPAISTIHPADVIDDPAIMVGMLGAMTALACHLTHRAMFGRNLP